MTRRVDDYVVRWTRTKRIAGATILFFIVGFFFLGLFYDYPKYVWARVPVVVCIPAVWLMVMIVRGVPTALL